MEERILKHRVQTGWELPWVRIRRKKHPAHKAYFFSNNESINVIIVTALAVVINLKVFQLSGDEKISQVTFCG